MLNIITNNHERGVVVMSRKTDLLKKHLTGQSSDIELLL